MAERIGMAHVAVNEAARRNVADCLDSGMLSRGRYVEQFEHQVVEFAGARYAIAVCNGTMADTILLQAVQIVHGFDRAVMPALTFAAQLSAVVASGLEPVVRDVDEHMLMYPSDTIGQPAGAILFPASLLGMRYDVDDDAGGDETIVDSCECFAPGIASDCLACTCSFYSTHTVATGEGGMILTRDADIADVCRSLRDHGQRVGGPLDNFRHFYCGHNAKMSNVAAAIGCGMMLDVEETIARRMEVARWYDELTGQSWFKRMSCPHGYPVQYDSPENRDAAIMRLAEAGVDSRRLFSVLPNEHAFRHLGLQGRYPIARKIASHYLYLPCHQGLSRADVERAVSVARSD